VAEAIVELARIIRDCEKAGLTQAALAMAYVAMDAMAYLALPDGRDRQEGADYVAWVDRYLKGHPDQAYQYRGTDVYGARCAYLHNFSSQATFHERNPDTKYFAYTDGGRHLLDPAAHDRLVLIGAASFLNDVVCALDAFLGDCANDADLRRRVEQRSPHLLVGRPIKRSKE
jgi:hypothetical protein